MKQDLKKIKQLLLSVGFLLAIVLTVSLIAVLIAALAYAKPVGSQVRISENNNITTLVNLSVTEINYFNKTGYCRS